MSLEITWLMMTRRKTASVVAAVLSAALLCMAADSSWLEHVSPEDRKRTNPFASQQDAVAAGSKIFSDHCAKCHGADAQGRGKKPSLRTKEVQQAADGEIFWLLRNGSLRRGMPTWSSLPEQSRWQVIAYVKSLGEKPAQ